VKKKIINSLFLGLLLVSQTGCIASKLGLNNNTSEEIQPSEGTTNKVKTISTGAVTGAVAGAVLGKIFKVDSKISAIAGAMVGSVLGDMVAKNNEQQANDESALADEEAAYNTKTEELERKINLNQ